MKARKDNEISALTLSLAQAAQFQAGTPIFISLTCSSLKPELFLLNTSHLKASFGGFVPFLMSAFPTSKTYLNS